MKLKFDLTPKEKMAFDHCRKAYALMKRGKKPIENAVKIADNWSVIEKLLIRLDEQHQIKHDNGIDAINMHKKLLRQKQEDKHRQRTYQ